MAIGSSFSSRRGLVLLPLGMISAMYVSRQKPAFDVPEVELPSAKALFDAGVLILDVRKADRYEYRHIVGAMLMPLATIQACIPTAIEYARELAILVYCGDGLSIGPEATRVLRQAGYLGAVNLKAGIEGWASAGFPIKQASG